MEILTILNLIFIVIMAGVVIGLVKLYNNLKFKTETNMKRIECLEFERDAKGEKFIIEKRRVMFNVGDHYNVKFVYNNEIKSKCITIYNNEKIIIKGDYLVIEKTTIDSDWLVNYCAIYDINTEPKAVFTIIDGELKEIPVELYTKAMKNN